MGSIIGDVVFAVFAVVGLYFTISRFGEWLLSRASGTKKKMHIKKCTVYIWPEDDSEHVESALRGVRSVVPCASTEYVVVLNDLSEDVREICYLFAREYENVSTTECFM